MTRRSIDEPLERVGICCGRCDQKVAHLYKVPGLSRYRCLACYVAEMGERPAWLLPVTPADETLGRICMLMSGREWSADTCAAIAEELRAAGWQINEVRS